MKHSASQSEKIIKDCVSAYLSHTPILYLRSDDMELVDRVILDQSMVELRRWKGLNPEFVELKPIPEPEVMDYLRTVNDTLESGTEEEGSKTKGKPGTGTARWKKNVKVFYPGYEIDPLSYIRTYGEEGKVPVIMAVKNYNLALNAVMAEGKGKTEGNIERYIMQYLCAPPGSVIRKSVLILASSELILPKGLEDYIAVIEPEHLAAWEIGEIVLDAAKEQGEILEKNYRDELVDRLKGFDRRQIRNILLKVVYEAGYLANNQYTLGRSEEELPETVAFDIINEEKRQMLSKEGVLEYEVVEQELNVGGMDALMKYLEEKCHFILRHRLEFKRSKNIDFPKGILVCGVPGTGKSMMARKIAQILNIPLVSMDMGSITKSYLGQSADQMRKALKMADAMAPCVLWIDEIEKAFAGVKGQSAGDSASSEVMRCFGMFLRWMQEQGERKRKNEDPPAPCFIFATANDIGSLPPEFLRSGRFDQKFYVFMPSEQECIRIFKADMQTMDQITDENGNKVPLFDYGSMGDAFWKSIMDFCVKGDRRKLLTGSDIHGINQDAVRYLLYGEYGGDTSEYRKKSAAERYEVLEQNFKAKKIVQKPYGAEEYGRALRRSIRQSRPYGETNLNEIAKCYIGLRENSFSPVSGESQVLIPFEEYDEEREEAVDVSEEKAKELHKDSNYNQQLYRVIGARINQLVKRRKRLGDM